MRKLTIARSALHKGGIPELVRVVRKWIAKIAYPGPLPAPARPNSTRKNKPRPAVPLAGTPGKVSTPAGKHSAGNVSHAEALAWFETRRPTYERLAAAVAPHVDRQGVILDVGANIGYFTKVLGEATDFQGTVHLFEPVPNLATLCRTTLLEAPFQTDVHEFGLSDEDATISIFIAADGNLGWNTIVAEKASTGMRPLQIQVRAFETCGIAAKPSLVKIDVEGAEYKVLRGMLPAIREWSPKPVILCEIGWGQNHPAWDQELEVFRSLEKLGYRAHDLNHRPMDIEDLRATTDVLFIPEQMD